MDLKQQERNFAAVILLLMVASFLMVFGHAKVISNDGIETTQALSNLYVSDFASHDQYGILIKAAIGVFCICVVLVLKSIASRINFARALHSVVWLWLLGFLMVGGLLMVAYYDSRPDSWVKTWQDFFHDRLPNWGIFSGIRGEDEKRSDDLHLFGFCLFAAGFLSMVVTNHWFKKWSGRGFARKTLLFCVACLLLLVWMCFTQASPGIPQRAFLVASAFWLVLSYRNYAAQSGTTPSQPAPGGDRSRF